MRWGASWFIALRFLLGKGSEGRGGRRQAGHSYLRGAVLGIALSLVPLVLVLVVADGMIEGITSRYIETSTYHIQLHPLMPLSVSELSDSAQTLRKNDKLLRAVYPELQAPALAITRGRESGALVRAVDPALLADPGFRSYVELKTGELNLDGNAVLLGEALAGKLGVKPGDVVSLVTNRDSDSGSSLSPRLSPFRVKAVISAGYRDLDAHWAFISLKNGGRILPQGSSRSFLGVKLEKPYEDLTSASEELAKSLEAQDSFRSAFGWTALTWAQAELNLWKSFSTTRALLLLIMALAVAIAAVNVGSSLVMLVIERKKDIAILKSTGLSDSGTATVFILAGSATGILGTAIGMLSGCLLSLRINEIIAILETSVNWLGRASALLAGRAYTDRIRLLDPGYYLEKIPVNLKAEELIAISLLSILLCCLASLIPARKAAAAPPIVILKNS